MSESLHLFSIENLEITDSNISKDVIENLIKSLKKSTIKRFSTFSFEKLEDVLCEMLESNTLLEELDIHYLFPSKCEFKIFKSLCENTNLKSLVIENTDFKKYYIDNHLPYLFLFNYTLNYFCKNSCSLQYSKENLEMYLERNKQTSRIYKLSPKLYDTRFIFK